MNTRKVQNNIDILKRMTSEYGDYLKAFKRGGDWDMQDFMQSLYDKAVNIENGLQEEEK